MIKCMRKIFLVLIGLVICAANAHAEETIKIGDMHHYTKGALYSWPYRKGWQLALEEINNSGGVLGKKLEVLSRDDKGEPSEAVRVAQELIMRDNVSALMGSIFGHVALAISNTAGHYKVPYVTVSGTSKLTNENFHPYIFIVPPTLATYNHYLAKRVAEENTKGKKWAVIAANYEGGVDTYKNFRNSLQQYDPAATWITEQWPAMNKLKAGPTIQAINFKKPEAILILIPGGDAKILVREGKKRGLFKDRVIVSMPTGYAEEMAGYGAEYPEGWYTTGYPVENVNTPANKAFLNAYKAKYGEAPQFQSLWGYVTLKTLAKVIEKAGSADREKIRDALEGIEVDTPIGRIKIDPKTHQGDAGVFVGRTALIDGKPAFVDYKFYKGDGVVNVKGNGANKK